MLVSFGNDYNLCFWDIERYSKLLQICIGNNPINLSSCLHSSSESDLYIFDEPLNGLDDMSRELFLSDLHELKERGKTIIVCTHEPDFFKKLYTNKIILDGGEISE